MDTLRRRIAPRVLALVRHARPFHWREASLCAPAMPLLILLGDATGAPVAGATAAGAAFAVAFGSARELRGRRWGAMGMAMAGMALAGFAGCLAGQHFALFVGLAAAVSAGCAALALHDEDLWWVALQVAIAFFVAGSYAGSLDTAIERAATVAAGGAVQIGTVVLLARLFPAASAPTIDPQPLAANHRLMRAHMTRAAICVAASLVVTHRLGLASAYWAPMTALLVLKPRLHETAARGLARLLGTLGGCALATGYAHLCRDHDLLLTIGLTGSAVAAFALQKAHYASLTAAITATIVLLLTLGHSPALLNAEHRIAATVIGGAIALLVARALSRRHAGAQPAPDQVGASPAALGPLSAGSPRE